MIGKHTYTHTYIYTYICIYICVYLYMYTCEAAERKELGLQDINHQHWLLLAIISIVLVPKMMRISRSNNYETRSFKSWVSKGFGKGFVIVHKTGRTSQKHGAASLQFLLEHNSTKG